MTSRLLCGDALAFARHYHGEPFHALLCDPPYHLHNGMTRPRLDLAEYDGGNGNPYARVQSRSGFMGKQWDGGDIAFRAETWAALAGLLYPGAFVMAFAGTRGYHRMAVAAEDAGLIIHPAIGWVFGSGFPKATRVNGEENFAGHRYGLQALKPAFEFIMVAQKPYTGRPLDSIVATGAGALNIDGGRIGTNGGGGNGLGSHYDEMGNCEPNKVFGPDETNSTGRWPANFALCHSPECKRVGERRVKGDGREIGDGANSEAQSEGWGIKNNGRVSKLTDSDGLETVAAWECVDGCAVKMMDEQSGEHEVSGTARLGKPKSYKNTGQGVTWPAPQDDGIDRYNPNDSGTASRFFFQADWQAEVAEQIEQADPVRYQAKAARAERDAGLSEFWYDGADVSGGGGTESEKADVYQARKSARHNAHPTVKPIALARWLATLLFPPLAYAPRRLLVPFAGVGSEMVGAWLAGWDDVIGIEKEREYAAIGRARIDYWLRRGKQMEMEFTL